jgi:hypothetical protein
MDQVSKTMRWENREMDAKEEVEFFQELIDSGLVWKLQGMYGRYANQLILTGLCHPKRG